ncbi:MAG TPA: SDR family oxidoreductase [Alphaproteobacteria bacterium]|nr:SDR family oxidoreductase [Alphaproteobacteria bacterium]
MDSTDRYALVTGAGSGIGKAAALKLADAGFHVAVLGRTRDQLDETAEAVRARGRKALSLLADVAVEEQVREAFATAAAAFGRLDHVFANAGINGVWAPIEDLTYEEWNRTQAINVGGTFLTLHYAVPLMRARGGSIVITSSINGTRTFTTAGASAYSASKAAQLAFGKMAALELARYRIRVNVICPGAITTAIADNTHKRNTEAAKVPAEFPQGTVPLTGGKPGTADEVADLVVFLASDQSRHITGTPIWIDGAQSLLV